MYRSYSKALLCIVSSLVFILPGCSGNGSGSTIQIGKIDISGAKVLMVSPESSVINKAGNSNTNVFVKIKDNGAVEKVAVTDVDGEVVDVIPSNIYNATDAYVIIIVEGSTYLVAKADGSTYDLTPVGQPEMLRANCGYDGEIRKSIYSDNNGNIYYLSGGIVKKIDVNNPDSITAQNYTPDIYYINSANEFAVDKNGNVFFSYDINFQEYAKIKKSDGSLQVVSNLGSSRFLSFTGYDGELYYTDDGNGGQNYRWIYLNNSIFIIGNGTKRKLYGSEGNSSSVPDFLSTSKLKLLSYSSLYYYVATKQGAILKVDPADDSSVTLISDDQYDYYKMTVTSDDMVIFYALRFSDSKKVIGQISSDGTVSIIDETLDDDVLILEKIN